MIGVAKAVASRSKDQGTKVGAVAVASDWTVLGTGFNGFPRGAPDDELPTSGLGKHVWTIHAEVNALLSAITTGRLREPGCRVISTHRPCGQCLKMMAHLGVKECVYDVDQLNGPQLMEARLVAQTLGITVRSAT